MMRIAFMCIEAAAAAIFLLPLLLLLNKFRFHNGKHTIAYFIFTLYLAAMWAVVGLPNVTYMRFELHFQLIPFAGIIADLRNSILNVLLFIPLGCFLPVLWMNFRSAKKTVLLGLGTSAFIELFQILTFRATDINDLITNTLGSLIGWLISSSLLKRLSKNLAFENSNDVFLLYGCVFVVMFFLQPFLSNLFWNHIY